MRDFEVQRSLDDLSEAIVASSARVNAGRAEPRSPQVANPDRRGIHAVGPRLTPSHHRTSQTQYQVPRALRPPTSTTPDVTVP